MSTPVYRPHHTGSARIQSLKSAQQSRRRERQHPPQPTHVFVGPNAIAVECQPAPHQEARPPLRMAKRPLSLPDGSQALGVKKEDTGVSVLVRSARGIKQWRKAEHLGVQEAVWRFWVREAFF